MTAPASNDVFACPRCHGALIDGKRSIADIAPALGQQWGVPAEVLTNELRPLLARLPFD